MRIVALEEHFQIHSLIERSGLSTQTESHIKPKILQALREIGPERLSAMDDAEISVQVLSAAAPGADLLDGDPGIQFARATNDSLADFIRKNPSRLAGFAHLPMRSPEAAADELERCVTQLRFCGALINGTTQDLFLDDKKFAPLLSRAEKLNVPLYIHPAAPPVAVKNVYYDRLPENYGTMLSLAGFGWHIEVAIHVLRMALAGTFDHHPRLKIIIGHMGETIPFMLERSEQIFQSVPKPISVKEKILKHVWLTTSGFFSIPPFLNALSVFGVDRILFSVDYPFAPNLRGRDFLKSLPVSEDDRLKIASGNADKLLSLQK